nr:MAG: RNA-dependent RNA polymerase [Riboviria sp.]
MLTLMAARKRYPLHFESAVGCNSAGKDWDQFARFLWWKDRMTNGDYKGFDKRLPPEIMMSVFDYYIHILSLAGFDSDDLLVVRGIATEICYPCYEMMGAIIKVSGSNPSGHALTVEVNNDSNRLAKRYVYYSLHEGSDVPLYSHRVHMLCYGDDDICSVSPHETKFTHTAVADELGKIGMEYTMADKSSESVPLISLDECDFLKRAFRFDNTLGAYVGALDKKSILKRLHFFKDKTPMSKSEYVAEALSSAAQEMFLHGEGEYDTFVDIALKVAQEIDSGLELGFKVESLLKIPSYEQLRERYELTDSVMLLYPQSGRISLEARWAGVMRELEIRWTQRNLRLAIEESVREKLVLALHDLFFDVHVASDGSSDDHIFPPRVGRFRSAYVLARHMGVNEDDLMEALEAEYHRLVVDEGDWPDIDYSSLAFSQMADGYYGDLRARHILMWYRTPIRHMFPEPVAKHIWDYAQPTIISVGGWYFSLV